MNKNYRTNNIDYVPKFKKGDKVRIIKTDKVYTVHSIMPEAGGNWYNLEGTLAVYHEVELERV